MSVATFQSTVRTTQGFGVVGELFSDAPHRAEPFQINDTADNFVGRMMTVVSEGVARSGGSGALAGILFNPKVYAARGDGVNALNPSLEVADFSEVEGLKMGELIISLAADAAIGDAVKYLIATGVLSTYKKTAAFTASQATDQLTVSAITQGRLDVGSVVKNAAGEILGTIIALGTGTGGIGTYTLNTSATVGSAAMTANTVLASTDADAYGEITRFTPNAGTTQLAVAYFNMPY